MPLRSLLLRVPLPMDLDWAEKKEIRDRTKEIVESSSPDDQVPARVASMIFEAFPLDDQERQRARLLKLFEPFLSEYPGYDEGRVRDAAFVSDSYFETDIASEVRARGIAGRRRSDVRVDGHSRHHR